MHCFEFKQLEPLKFTRKQVVWFSLGYVSLFFIIPFGLYNLFGGNALGAIGFLVSFIFLLVFGGPFEDNYLHKTSVKGKVTITADYIETTQGRYFWKDISTYQHKIYIRSGHKSFVSYWKESDHIIFTMENGEKVDLIVTKDTYKPKKSNLKQAMSITTLPHWVKQSMPDRY